MNRELQRYLEQLIRTEYVSVVHDYDQMETSYTIPYNATSAPRKIKIMLLRADGIIDDEDEIDGDDDIDALGENLFDFMTPEFVLSTTHYINNRNKLVTQYTLDFDGTILYQKSYPSDTINARSPIFRLMKMCSDKVITQERVAQKYKMEKMFLSMNMFKLNAQRGRK